MPDPTYSQLRAYHRVAGALLTDPECHGDLLLLGLWWARAVTLRVPPPGGNRWSQASAARDLFQRPLRDLHPRELHEYPIGGQMVPVDTHAINRVYRLLVNDRPHYDARLDDRRHPQRRLCGAPMIRRDGTCGGSLNVYQFVTDPDTGRKVRVGACLRHRRDGWYDDTIAAWQQRLAAAGGQPPAPPANTGGVLQRHIRGVRWDEWWARHVPDWERPTDDERAPGRPQLAVLSFEPTEPAGDTAARPTLGVVDGGGG